MAHAALWRRAQCAVSEVLERYKNEVSVHKHGWCNETNIINRVLRTPLAEVRLPHLSELQFQDWADERKKEVSMSTLRREDGNGCCCLMF